VPIFRHDLRDLRDLHGRQGGEVAAVLAVTRHPSRPEFDAADQVELERLAAQASPYLTALLPEGRAC